MVVLARTRHTHTHTIMRSVGSCIPWRPIATIDSGLGLVLGVRKGKKSFSKRERGGEFDRQKEPMLSTQVMLDILGGATAYVYETTYLKMHYPLRLKVRFRGSSPPYQNGRVPCHVPRENTMVYTAVCFFT